MFDASVPCLKNIWGCLVVFTNISVTESGLFDLYKKLMLKAWFVCLDQQTTHTHLLLQKKCFQRVSNTLCIWILHTKLITLRTDLTCYRCSSLHIALHCIASIHPNLVLPTDRDCKDCRPFQLHCTPLQLLFSSRFQAVMIAGLFYNILDGFIGWSDFFGIDKLM